MNLLTMCKILKELKLIRVKSVDLGYKKLGLDFDDRATANSLVVNKELADKGIKAYIPTRNVLRKGVLHKIDEALELANNKKLDFKDVITIKPNPKETNACWWDDECESKKKETINAIGVALNNPSLENVLAWKKTNAEAKKLYKTKKQTSFRLFAESLNRNTDVREVWKKNR